MEPTRLSPALAIACLLAACADPPSEVELEDPLPGLTPEELARFERGEELFERGFTPEQGLGPLFNAEGCATCHAEPTDGGAGPIRERHVSGPGPSGSCDLLLALGGPVLQQRATPALAALGILDEPLPSATSGVGLRSTPDVFGFGLLDAIPDATVLALADPDDRDGDGISGRAHLLPGGHIGRFGRKAAVSSLRAFNEGAVLFEMGLTTSVLPEENSIAGAALPKGVDPTGEPEMPDADVCFLDAAAAEFRTEPLMGLRHLTLFLHDDRADTVEGAIRAHGVEAAASRAAFLALEDSERRALLAFLASI